MDSLVNCKCGGVPQRIAKKGRGVAICCPTCLREYSSPYYTWEQLCRVWNYANGTREDGCEDE